MKTLKEHDGLRREAHRLQEELKNPHPNGIECPTCKEELQDTNPTVVLTGNPPKKDVHCPACGYTGYALR